MLASEDEENANHACDSDSDVTRDFCRKQRRRGTLKMHNRKLASLR